MSPSAQDPSEDLVFKRCQKLYFALWSYLNPLRHDGSELCDVLVAFGDHLLVISVKNVDFNPDGPDPAVRAERWRKRAIEKSVRQARGAKRYLQAQERYEVRSIGVTDHVIIENVAANQIHCISISLGGRGEIPYGWGSDENSPTDVVHIFTEVGLEVLLGELSTITDLVRYLAVVEDFYARTQAGIVFGSELDLLALYVRNNRTLPDWSGQNIVILDGTFWEGVTSEPEYKARLREDQISYFWDHIAADLIEHQVGNTYIAGSGKESLEPVLRRIASESRFSRRLLSKSFIGILEVKADVRARMVVSTDGNLYVFMRVRRDEKAEDVAAELHARCHVALGQSRKQLRELRAIGIATQALDGNNLRSHVAAMITYTDWGQWHEDSMMKLQAGGIFKAPRKMHVHEDEYPTT